MRSNKRPASQATQRALTMAQGVQLLTRADKQRIASRCGIHVATLYRALKNGGKRK